MQKPRTESAKPETRTYPQALGSNDERAISEGFIFEWELAERIKKFFSTLIRHSKGRWAGKPFELLDWQYYGVVAPLFGWVHKDTRLRRFRTAYIGVPKKNGKSTLCSGLALALMIADQEQGAEVYGAAVDKQQASIVFNEALNMVKASESLSKHCKVIPSTKHICHPASNSFYAALSADVASKEGLNIHALVFDELHAQKNRHMWDTLRYGGRARTQPMTIAISTAGFDKNSIGYEVYSYAKSVANGTIADTSFYSLIYEANDTDDLSDPAVWYKANPSMGHTITKDQMLVDYQEAKSSPSQLNSFKRYLLNIWTEQEERSIDMDEWDSCAGVVNPNDLEGVPCHAAIDLASTRDTNALVMVFNVDGKLKVLPFFWVPEDTSVERDRKSQVPYLHWIREGFMDTTPGNVTDYDWIIKRITELNERFPIQRIAYDPWSAQQMANKLADSGFDLMPFRQGYSSMTGPSKELERLIACKGIEHGKHPVLRWQAGNLCLTQDPAGNKKPDKARSCEKIDGMVALIMAIGSIMLQEGSGNSRYETDGLMVL